MLLDYLLQYDGVQAFFAFHSSSFTLQQFPSFFESKSIKIMSKYMTAPEPFSYRDYNIFIIIGIHQEIKDIDWIYFMMSNNMLRQNDFHYQIPAAFCILCNIQFFDIGQIEIISIMQPFNNLFPPNVQNGRSIFGRRHSDVCR